MQTSLINNDDFNGSGAALNLGDPESLRPDDNFETASISDRLR